MIFRSRLIVAAGLLGSTVAAQAAMQTFNSSSSDFTTTRNDWLSATGIVEPQFLVDFESGFVDGQNVSGLNGLFPGGLVIRDTSAAGVAAIEGTPGGIGGSNPVGSFALEHNEQAYLELDFSAAPIDYFSMRDIDHTGTTIIVTFVGGDSASTSIETTGGTGNSAEFFAIFRNDMARIARIQLDSSGDGSWGIDNLEYGASAVPVPGAMWLLGSALLGLIGIRRR